MVLSVSPGRGVPRVRDIDRGWAETGDQHLANMGIGVVSALDGDPRPLEGATAGTGGGWGNGYRLFGGKPGPALALHTIAMAQVIPQPEYEKRQYGGCGFRFHIRMEGLEKQTEVSSAMSGGLVFGTNQSRI
jgi:hypothetical protein